MPKKPKISAIKTWYSRTGSSTRKAIRQRLISRSLKPSLGEFGQRLVTVYSVQISPIVEGKGTANVIFSAETSGGEVSSTTNWTAKLDYIYKELITKPIDNPKTGNQDLQIIDPQFQVVNYVLQQNP